MIKKYRPVTPSRRQMTGINYRQVLTAVHPHKPLTSGGKRSVGRNKAGRITTRHKGGGHKRLYRQIDFRYNKIDIPAKITSVEYDPNRSGFIALCLYADGERRYVLLPAGLSVGESFVVSEKAEIKVGNRLPLKKIPIGTQVYNIETQPGSGAKLARSAGNFAEVLSTDAGYTTLKMPSSEVRKVHANSWASVGPVSNEEHRLVTIGKAGRSRWMGIRPTVRGSAMNPVDHPYGGGEGRTGRGLRRAKTKWGKPSGGVKTRRTKKYSDSLRVSRRQTKRRK